MNFRVQGERKGEGKGYSRPKYNSTGKISLDIKFKKGWVIPFGSGIFANQECWDSGDRTHSVLIGTKLASGSLDHF